MFITYSLPFIDLRTFLNEDTHRMNDAIWKYPDYKKTYIPSMGVIMKRHKLNQSITYFDRQYVNAAQAMHIDTNYISERFPSFSPYMQFRRFYYDNFTGRFDAGLRSQCSNRINGVKDKKRWEYSSFDLCQLVEWLFGMQVNIKTGKDIESGKSVKTRTTLYDAGGPLARLFAYATTIKPAANYSEELGDKAAWLAPQIILECRANELKECSTKTLDRNTRFIKLSIPALEEWDTGLYLTKIRQCPVWVIAEPRGGGHYDDIKNLRIYLTKLQQSRSAIKCLFKQLKLHQNGFNPQNLNVREIEKFISESLKLIGRKKQRGYSVEPITKVLNQIDSIINGDELDFLLDEYEDIKEIYHFKGRLMHMANSKSNFNIHMNGGQFNIIEGNNGTVHIEQLNGIKGEELNNIIANILQNCVLAPTHIQEQISEIIDEVKETITQKPDKTALEKCRERLSSLAKLVQAIPALAEGIQSLFDFTARM